MPTKFTKKQEKSFLAQIKSAADQIAALKRQKSPGLQSPSVGEVLGASTTELNDAQKYGAAGRGEYLTPELSSDIEKATKEGVPMAALGDKNKTGKTNLERPKGYVEPKLNANDSLRYVKSFGLEGILDSASFAGLTASEANKRALDERKKRVGQISGNTTYTFNPETLKRTQRAIDKFNFALDEADKDPFEPKKFKQETRNNLLEITSKELGQFFTSPDEIYSAYNFNPQFKATLDAFMKKGGTIEGIAKNISTSVAQPTIDASRAAAVQNLMRQGVTNPADILNYLNYDETGKLIGDFTPEEVAQLSTGRNNQSPADYLASLRNPKADQEAEQMAIEELAPESDIAQEEIMRVNKIPSDLKTLYFGDERNMGIVQMRRKQAEEETKILEEKERDAKRTARDKANLTIERNKAEARAQNAKIEENRLAAKNYMTAQLAKLGALQTTGAAVLALQTLETKYQQQADKLASDLKLATREIQIGLDESLDKIENDTDDKILAIQEDLTKDSETIAKEVMKAQNDAEKETYRITEQYGRRLREATVRNTKELKAAAEKYAKEFAKKASGGIDFNSTGTVASKSKIVTTIENILEGSRGSDGYVNSEEYAKQLKAWIKKGGTAKTFVAAFPPKLYANPEDTSLPPNLRYARESQTLKTDSGDDIDAQIAAWAETNLGSGE